MMNHPDGIRNCPCVHCGQLVFWKIESIKQREQALTYGAACSHPNTYDLVVSLAQVFVLVSNVVNARFVD